MTIALLVLSVLNLAALGLLAYQQHHNHQAVLERLDDIDTDVEAMKRARADLLQFVRKRISERVSDFKTGGGRERLRARLEQKRG